MSELWLLLYCVYAGKKGYKFETVEFKTDLQNYPPHCVNLA